MKKIPLHKIAGIVLGLLFLVSAFAKAWDADAFGHMLLLYGPRWFGAFAPVIIFCEVVLGMCLLLHVRPKGAAVVADIFLLTVSAVFAYGVLFKGIQSCGCFGVLERYYTSKPWMTFARNSVFIALTLPILFAKPEKEQHLTQKLIAMLILASVACFICGLAMKKSFRLPRMRYEKRTTPEQVMAKIQDLYPFSADSTYAVYLFSFTCPHCMNSYANVAQYRQMGLVDKVLGIAVEDTEAQARFERIYKPDFEIITIPHDSMSHITHSLPLMLHIEGGTIRDIEAGFVLSPGLFME